MGPIRFLANPSANAEWITGMSGISWGTLSHVFVYQTLNRREDLLPKTWFRPSPDNPLTTVPIRLRVI